MSLADKSVSCGDGVNWGKLRCQWWEREEQKPRSPNEFYLSRLILGYSYISLESYGEQEAFDSTCVLIYENQELAVGIFLLAVTHAIASRRQ